MAVVLHRWTWRPTLKPGSGDARRRSHALTGFGNETSCIEPLLGQHVPRIANAGHFALRNRVLLLKSPSGVGIDISLAGLPFEHSAVARSSLDEFAAGVLLRTCSAEDLMVMKLFAFRGIDQRDAAGIAIRNGTGLDWGYVEEHLVPLAELKEDPAILREFHRLRALHQNA